MTSNAISRVAAPLRQEVTRTLRAAIVTAEFGPGERLVETSLCKLYGVSRTVVREALRQLETEGLVTIVPNRGPQVATLTASEAHALYEARRALESLTAELFAERAEAPARAELGERAQAVDDCVTSEDLENFLDIKDAYYATLCRGAANPEVERMLTRIHARTQTLRVLSLGAPDQSRRTVDEIWELTRACMAGDVVTARAVAEQHVRGAEAAAISAMNARGLG